MTQMELLLLHDPTLHPGLACFPPEVCAVLVNAGLLEWIGMRGNVSVDAHILTQAGVILANAIKAEQLADYRMRASSQIEQGISEENTELDSVTVSHTFCTGWNTKARL